MYMKLHVQVLFSFYFLAIMADITEEESGEYKDFAQRRFSTYCQKYMYSNPELLWFSFTMRGDWFKTVVPVIFSTNETKILTL